MYFDAASVIDFSFAAGKMQNAENEVFLFRIDRRGRISSIEQKVIFCVKLRREELTLFFMELDYKLKSGSCESLKEYCSTSWTTSPLWMSPIRNGDDGLCFLALRLTAS